MEQKHAPGSSPTDPAYLLGIRRGSGAATPESLLFTPKSGVYDEK